MTVEIISWSNSTKVWYRAGIELATPGSAVRHASVARHVTDYATRPSKTRKWIVVKNNVCLFNPSNEMFYNPFWGGASFVYTFCYLYFVFVCQTVMSVPCSHVVTYWERADVWFLEVFVTFLRGVLGSGVEWECIDSWFLSFSYLENYFAARHYRANIQGDLVYNFTIIIRKPSYLSLKKKNGRCEGMEYSMVVSVTF